MAGLPVVAQRLRRHRYPFSREAKPPGRWGSAGGYGWAELLKRVFGVNGWECPDCGKRMRLRTVVEGSPAALTITKSLLRSTGPPRPPSGGDDREAYAGA